jgi:hypothetical protein
VAGGARGGDRTGVTSAVRELAAGEAPHAAVGVVARPAVIEAASIARFVVASAAAVKVAVEAARESIAVPQRLVAECGPRAVACGIKRVARGVVIGPVIFARVLARVGLAYLHAHKASTMGVEAIVDGGELA